jgi:glycosyltransferase involved in cell wall biosynthesis
MKEQPLVSIIIPTYNRAHLIGETLDSVLAQTYTNWECIIVDDGSSDNTDEVVSEYVKKDPRFKYYQRPDEHLPGGNGARNFGFKMSKGEYVNWLDSDDLLMPNKIELQINEFLKSKLDMVACYALVFGDFSLSNKKINYFIPKKTFSKYPSYDILAGNVKFQISGPLWKRGFLTNKKLFDERLKRSQDADFNFRISINGLDFKFIEKPLDKVRRNKNENKIKRNKLDNDLNFITSIFYYFENAFNTSKKIGQSNVHYIYRKRMMNYAFYRMMFQYTRIRLLSFNQSKKYLKNIFIKLFLTPMNFFIKIRIFIGLLLFHFTKKGYKIIHIKSLSLK